MTTTTTSHRIRRPRHLRRTAVALGLGAAVLSGTALSSQALFTSSDTSTATIAALSGYSRAVLNDSPVAYYPLDERSGTTARNLITPSAGALLSDASGTVAPGGSSLSRNAGGSVVVNGGAARVTNLPAPTAVGSKVTVEFWMNLPASTVQTMPFSFDSAITLFLDEGWFGFNTGAGDILGVRAAPLLGRPVHVVAVFAVNSSNADYPASRTLYIDGVQQTLTQYTVRGGTTPLVRSLASSAQVSGWVLNPAYRLTGGTMVSDLAVYDRGLTAAQAQAHYLAGKP